MEPLIVEGQRHTPEVCLDPSTTTFVIKGRSYPENADKFYTQVKDWLVAFDHDTPYTITFRFDYLSSSSVVAVLTMLRELEKKSVAGKEISILWLYDEDDDDLKRTGEDLMNFVNLNIHLESVVELE